MRIFFDIKICPVTDQFSKVEGASQTRTTRIAGREKRFAESQRLDRASCRMLRDGKILFVKRA